MLEDVYQSVFVQLNFTCTLDRAFTCKWWGWWIAIVGIGKKFKWRPNVISNDLNFYVLDAEQVEWDSSNLTRALRLVKD